MQSNKKKKNEEDRRRSSSLSTTGQRGRGGDNHHENSQEGSRRGGGSSTTQVYHYTSPSSSSGRLILESTSSHRNASTTTRGSNDYEYQAEETSILGGSGEVSVVSSSSEEPELEETMANSPTTSFSIPPPREETAEAEGEIQVVLPPATRTTGATRAVRRRSTEFFEWEISPTTASSPPMRPRRTGDARMQVCLDLVTEALRIAEDFAAEEDASSSRPLGAGQGDDSKDASTRTTSLYHQQHSIDGILDLILRHESKRTRTTMQQRNGRCE